MSKFNFTRKGNFSQGNRLITLDDLEGRDADVNAALSATFAGVGAVPTNQIRAFMRKLAIAADPVTITAVGDSTGAMVGSWLNGLIGTKLAAAFPAWTIQQRNYDVTNEKYADVSTVIQTGTAGPRRFVSTGTSTDRIFNVADSASTSPTGDLDVRMKVLIPSTATAVTLAGKYDTATNNRAWFIQMDATGKLALFFSTDGTSGTQLTRTATAALPAPAVNAVVWLRVTFDVDDGAGNNVARFYYSTDNQATWTQIGSTVTNVGVQSIFDANAATQFNSRGGSANGGGMATEYHAFQLFTSLAAGARPVIDFETSAWNGYTAGAGTWTDYVGNTVAVSGTGSTGSMVGAPVLTFLNGCVSGQAIAYANDGTRFPKLTPKPSDLCFINFGHNEGSSVAYRTVYKQLADAVLAKWPDVGIIATVQNQRLSPAFNITEHAIRNGQILNLAASQRYALVDAYQALAVTGNAASYIRSDGIHPTVATDSLPAGFRPGADVIRDAAWLLFAAAA